MNTTGGWALLAVAGTMATGCGGGGDDNGLSKAEYVKQANAICTGFNTDGQRQAEKSFTGIRDESGLTPAKARGFLEALLPKYDRQLADLRALEPPKADRDVVARIYAAGEQDGKRIRRSIGDPTKLRSLVTTTGSLTPRFGALAKRYGLDACGQG